MYENGGFWCIDATNHDLMCTCPKWLAMCSLVVYSILLHSWIIHTCAWLLGETTVACNPFKSLCALQHSLFQHNLQRLMVGMKTNLLTQYVLSPFFDMLNNHIELMIVGWIVADNINECFWMVCDWVSMVDVNNAKCILRGVGLILKFLMDIK